MDFVSPCTPFTPHLTIWQSHAVMFPHSFSLLFSSVIPISAGHIKTFISNKLESFFYFLLMIQTGISPTAGSSFLISGFRFI